MKIRFAKLYEVEIYHNYYQSQISEDFKIEPTVLCQRQLANYGLLFKTTSKGFVVLYECSDDNAAHPFPIRAIEEDVKFSFILIPKNPFIINYSDLPLESQPNHIYYLHNLNDNSQNGRLLLSADTDKDHVSPMDRIELRPQYFIHTLESTRSNVEIEIVDELNHSLIKKTVLLADNMYPYPVDLRRYPPGKFTLLVDGDEALSFYADTGIIGKNVFGIIDLFQNDRVPSAYHFTNEVHAVRAKTYTVKIERRQTYWKYYVVLKYRPDIADRVSIDADRASTNSGSDDLPPVEFGREELHTFSDGTSAVPFLANTLLPLQEEPIKNIVLELTNETGEVIFEIKHLPNPTVTSIKPNDSDGRIYSEIFIYL